MFDARDILFRPTVSPPHKKLLFAVKNKKKVRTDAFILDIQYIRQDTRNPPNETVKDAASLFQYFPLSPRSPAIFSLFFIYRKFSTFSFIAFFFVEV